MKLLRSHSLPYLVAAFVSLIFSIVSLQHQLINPDGILYITTAQAYLQQGFSASLALYSWPFYSILIALAAKHTHLDLLPVANGLNTLLLILLTLSFIFLVDTLTKQRRLLWFAAVIILGYTMINDHRYYVVRDFGYWAFFLQAVTWTLYYQRTTQWRYAIALFVSIALACLFRFEGIFLLIFLPFMVFLNTDLPLKQRFFGMVKFCSFLLLGALLVLLYLHKHNMSLIDHFTHISHTRNLPARLPTQVIPRQGEILANALSADFPHSYGVTALLGGFVFFFIHLFIDTLTLPYTFLVGYAFYQHLMLPKQAQKVIFTLIGINLITVIVFLLSYTFLTARYLTPITLLLLPYACLGLANLRPRWLFWLMLSLIIVFGIGSNLPFGPSQQYLKQAGHWLRRNTDANTAVFLNDGRINFYADRLDTQWRAIPTENEVAALLSPERRASMYQYQYIVLTLRRSPDPLRAGVFATLGKPAVQFENQRGDGVYIFRISQ